MAPTIDTSKFIESLDSQIKRCLSPPRSVGTSAPTCFSFTFGSIFSRYQQPLITLELARHFVSRVENSLPADLELIILRFTTHFESDEARQTIVDFIHSRQSTPFHLDIPVPQTNEDSYRNMTPLVAAARKLKRLDMHLGRTEFSDPISVLQACNVESLEEIEITTGLDDSSHSYGKLLDQDFFNALRGFPNLKCLGVYNINLGDRCLEMVVDTCLYMHKEHRLEDISLQSITNLTEASLPHLTRLIKCGSRRQFAEMIQSPTQTCVHESNGNDNTTRPMIWVELQNCPNLFRNATRKEVESFMCSIETCSTLSYLSLENVGLSGDSKTLCRLLQALEAVEGPTTFVTIEEQKLLDTTVWDQLLVSLRHMQKDQGVNSLYLCERDPVIPELYGLDDDDHDSDDDDDNGTFTNEQVKEQLNALVSACHANPTLETLEIFGLERKDLCESAIIKDSMVSICMRNRILNEAKEALEDAKKARIERSDKKEPSLQDGPVCNSDASPNCSLTPERNNIHNENSTQDHKEVAAEAAEQSGARRVKQFPQGLWAFALARLNVNAGTFGPDPVHYVLRQNQEELLMRSAHCNPK